jgi:hypothetical protein
VVAVRVVGEHALPARLGDEPLGPSAGGRLPPGEEDDAVHLVDDRVEVPAHGVGDVEACLIVGVRDVGVEPHVQVHLRRRDDGEADAAQVGRRLLERIEVEPLVAPHGACDVEAGFDGHGGTPGRWMANGIR